MASGWSINLTWHREAWITLPCDVLYTGAHGPVVEVLWWDVNRSVWVHLVSEPFDRLLAMASLVYDREDSHVQMSKGDVTWLDRVQGLSPDACFEILQTELVPIP